MRHPVNKFQTKLLAIWAFQIWHIVRLPVAPGAHEKMITVFHVLAKTAQHSAWQWRWWQGRGRGRHFFRPIHLRYYTTGGRGGVSEGGGAALSTDADGEVTTFRFLLLRVSTPVCVDPAAAATAAAAEGKVNVA